MRRLSVLLSLLLLLVGPTTFAQGISTSLQLSIPIEGKLSAGQTHSYTISLTKDQFAQLAVDQRGLDVVVRVFAPDGKLLREVDTPSGSEGVEDVRIVSEFAGTYRVEVGALADDAAPGAYEIKVVELRKATDEELEVGKNENTRKAKGLALLIETAKNLDQFRLPETRVAMRIKAAQLLWPSNEKEASKLMAQAMETVSQIIADSADEEHDDADYQRAITLRQQIISALTPYDPAAALKFLQSTRLSTELMNQPGMSDAELESSLINQVMAADPKRAFELAEEMLKRSSSALLIETLTRLSAKDRELAKRLAHDMAKKVEGQDLIKSPEASYLCSSLVRSARTKPKGVEKQDGDAQPQALVTDEESRDLFLKILSDMLSYAPSEESPYSPEYGGARALATLIRQMEPEIKAYAADRAVAIEKKVSELIGSVNQQGTEWQRYQTAATTEPVETALESVAQAPPQMRDYLYQQVATRIATTGDIPRARQIVADRISNATQRKQVLSTLRDQAVTTAAEKGRFDEALKLLAKIPPSERTNLINQILDHIGPGFKKSLAVQYLEQARSLVTMSARAEDGEQMQALLAISRALAPHDVNRAFQIVEPLIEQFNEITAAAVTMNGFGQQYYNDGEINTANENPVANGANQLSDTLATLAMFDFDRAKRDAEGINRPDARIRVFLKIAERTLEIHLESDDSNNYDRD